MIRLILVVCFVMYCSVASATTYHTRLMVDFNPPYDNSLLYLYVQMNDSPTLAWTFTGNSWLDTTFTHKTDAAPEDEVVRFCGIYYDSELGYLPILPDVNVWYYDSPPVMTLHLTNYWTGYHVMSNIGPMFVPGLDTPPITMQWETWAVADAVIPADPPTSPVPEPGTFALVGFAIASLVAMKRRRRFLT